MPGSTPNSRTKHLPQIARPVFFLIALAFLATGPLLHSPGVVLNGSVTGRITDPTGAALPGATVSLQNLNTGVKTTVQAGRTGLYSFLTLAPGSYSLVASTPGFNPVDTRIQVGVGNATAQRRPVKQPAVLHAEKPVRGAFVTGHDFSLADNAFRINWASPPTMEIDRNSAHFQGFCRSL